MRIAELLFTCNELATTTDVAAELPADDTAELATVRADGAAAEALAVELVASVDGVARALNVVAASCAKAPLPRAKNISCSMSIAPSR